MALRHVAYQVTDLERTIAFFETHLGFQVLRSMEVGDGRKNVFLGPPDPRVDDGGALQLVESDGDVDTGDFEHAAVTVDSVDELAADIADDRILRGPETLEDAGRRILFVRTPDGWVFELVEDLE